MVLTIAIAAAVAGPSPSAFAGSKVNETTLYQNPEPSFSPNFVYGADGSPIDHTTNTFMRNPACPHAPGVLRHGKVYVDTYYPPLHSQVRFALYTTYVPAVAEAKVAIEQTQKREPTCAELYAYEPTADAQGNLHWYGQLKALANVACQPGAADRPNRWCQMQAYNALGGSGTPGCFVYADPVVDMDLDTKYADPTTTAAKPATRRRTPRSTTRGSVREPRRVRGHDLGEARLVVQRPGDDRRHADRGRRLELGPEYRPPTNGGTSFLGYGKVQTPVWSEWNEAWYDVVANKLATAIPSLKSVHRNGDERDPNVANYVIAFMHTYVQSYVTNNTNLAGFGKVGDQYHTFIQAICNASPWIGDTVDTAAWRRSTPTARRW